MVVQKDLRIAIVGGGVCGLTCAVALAKEGISAEIFEAASQFGEIGAGVGMGPNAVRILSDIGVLEDVLANCDEPEVSLRTFIFLSGMKGHEFVYDYPPKPEDCGLGLHRAKFLDALVKSIDPKRTHFNKRCKYVSAAVPPYGAIIHFEDGTTHEADVVLGADGIKSAVRAAVTREDARKQVVYSNTACYRGLIPMEDIRAAGVSTDLSKRPVCYVGMDKHLIIFPIRGGTVINVVAFTTDRSVPLGTKNRPDNESWVAPASQAELLEEYKGWGGDVLKTLGCIRNPSKWLVHVIHPPLETFVRGRVALLGDAAHAMLPHLGAGAGQALEDAHLLGKLLSNPQTDASNVEMVLKAYDHVRRPRAQMVWDRSVAAGSKYEGRGESGYTVQGMRDDLNQLWEPVWRHELFADQKQALAYMDRTGVFQSPSQLKL